MTARIPLLWPGMAVALLLCLLSMLGGAGIKLGSSTSVITMGLTCLGLALAWGYLIAGATAGSWPAKLVVTVALLLFLYASWKAMFQGYSAIVLVAGLVLFLAWRWRQPGSAPLLDFLVPGVIFLLLYGLIAERSALVGSRIGDAPRFFGLALDLQLATLSYLTSTVLMVVGAAIGEAGAKAAGAVAGRLAGAPVGVIAGLTALYGIGKIGWDLSRYHGPGWLTFLLAAAAGALWIWAARPRSGEWPARLPLVIMLAGAGYIVMANFGSRILPGMPAPALSLMSIYTPALVGLVIGGVCLAAGRRPPALLAGLAGIWLLVIAGNGETQVPLPVLSWLVHLPKPEVAAGDGMVHLVLLGWAGALWLRGRRDPAPYALVLTAMLLFLGFNGLDYLYEHQPTSLIPLAVFAAASLYCLGIIVTGARSLQGREAVAWTGIAVGMALLVFTAGQWLQLGALAGLYAANAMPYLGYAMFSLVVFAYGLMRQMARLTEQRGETA